MDQRYGTEVWNGSFKEVWNGGMERGYGTGVVPELAPICIYRSCPLVIVAGSAAKKRLRGVFRRLGGTAVQLHAARQCHVAKAWRCSGRIRLIKYIYVYP